LVTCFGLIVGSGRARLTGPAGGIKGSGDLPVAQADLAGGGGQRAEVGGRVGVQGAVGGPEQARVAVAFGLAGDPSGRPGGLASGIGRRAPEVPWPRRPGLAAGNDGGGRLPYCVTGLGALLHRDRVSYGMICHVLATSL